MSNPKLTDSEIVKALRSWLEEIRKARQEYLEKVNEEHYPSMRYEYLLSDTINEINRQKAEIERLKEEYNRLLNSELQQYEKGYNTGYDDSRKTAKAEAYKEFAERLKTKVFNTEYHIDRYYRRTLDNFLKEMVGE